LKTFYIFLFLLTSAACLSQDLYIPNNPYDNADEYTKKSAAFQREKWFYEQRMYPNNFIPEGAYRKALEQRDALRASKGFYFPNIITWNNVGPTPGYYFSYGNISGRVPTIKYNPTNPNIIYLGAAFGGVWKSTNGGTTWANMSDYEASLSSGALAIDPTNTNIIYYGTGEATYSGASYYGRGLLKSTNGGLSWVNYTSGLPSSTYCSRIVIRPNHPSEIFGAFGTSGLYKSTNSGVNWTSLVSGRCDDIIFKSSGDTAYIAGSGTGYMISTNGGLTFTANTALTMSTRNHIAFCKSSPNVMYAAIYGSSNVNVFKSINSGLNYTQVVTNLTGGGQAWYDFFMHCSPFDPNLAYVGAIDVWRTTNGGVNFINITNAYGAGTVHPDQHNMDFHPTNPNEIICSNDGGVWKSTTQGTTWINLNQSLTITQFYWMASDPTFATHLIGGTQDNGTQQTYANINWTAAFGGDGGVACFHIKNANYVLGETQNNGLMKSFDNGASWTNATTGLTGSGAWVAPIICHPDSVEIFYTARQQVFKTVNMGSSWTPISSGTSGTISQMDISRTSANIMYASSGSALYKSTDRGYTFASSSSGLPGKSISSIHIHPDSAKVAIVTYSGFGAGKIYKTIDGGASWTNISGDLPDSPVNDGMIYHPGFNTSYYLVAMDIGVFMSSNRGVNWIELANGLPNTVAMRLDYNQLGNKIILGTHGRGTYQITGSLINIVNYNNEIPKEYMLLQNYPNPFNPNTRIKFAIVNKGFTRLEVYDMLGKKINTLIEKALDAGTYEVNFDGSNLSSGIYYYKLTTQDYSDAKKMILMK
jgi:photosystem II stability/assembly factor-like uncharacterized protein